MKNSLTRPRRSLVSLFTVSLLLVASRPLSAATLTWTNVAGGTWSAAANWSPNQVPGEGDAVVITANGTYTNTLDTSASVASLTLGGAVGQQTLAQAGRSLTLASASTIRVRGGLEASGALTCNGPLSVSGRIIWASGIITGEVTVGATGSLRLESSNDHEFIGTLTNAGTVRWSGGTFYLENASTFLNQAGGLFDVVSNNTLQPFGTRPESTRQRRNLSQKRQRLDDHDRGGPGQSRDD